MWSLQRLLFERQTGSSLPILEVCGFRFSLFWVMDLGQHIFQLIGTKFRTELKLSNANFVLSGK